jgi:hypothetical protein
MGKNSIAAALAVAVIPSISIIIIIIVMLGEVGVTRVLSFPI